MFSPDYERASIRIESMELRRALFATLALCLAISGGTELLGGLWTHLAANPIASTMHPLLPPTEPESC